MENQALFGLLIKLKILKINKDCFSDFEFRNELLKIEYELDSINGIVSISETENQSYIRLISSLGIQ